MSGTDRLFRHDPAQQHRQQTLRRRRLRGELVPRDEPSFEWADHGRIGDDWDECALVTVECHAKLTGGE